MVDYTTINITKALADHIDYLLENDPTFTTRTEIVRAALRYYEDNLLRPTGRL